MVLPPSLLLAIVIEVLLFFDERPFSLLYFNDSWW